MKPPAIPALPASSVWSDVALLLLPALCLAIPGGYSYGAGVLLLTSLLGARIWWFKGKSLPLQAWQLYLSAMLLALSWLLDSMLSHAGGSAVEKPLKIAFTLPCYFYLMWRPPRIQWLWTGTVAGSLAACVVAFWQIATASDPTPYIRTNGFTNAIQFGNLALLLGMLALCAWNAPPSHAVRWQWRALLGVAFTAGLVVSLLSGSRGGWLALVLLLGLQMVYWSMHGHWRSVMLASVVLAVALLGVLAIPKLNLQNRLNEATNEIDKYHNRGKANTSVGARLQMWKFASGLYQQRPILGWSQKGYMEQVSQAITTEKLDPRIATYDHPHNEVLDSASKRGTVGLLLLLGIYCAPLWVFGKLFRNSRDPHLRAVCAAGMLLPLSYAFFGLTEAFLPHNSASTFYFYMLPLLWGSSWGIRKQNLLLTDN
ncbi:MAG: O-antigen ligase family protein [Brachymonas sp.]|nr:O-antigen ligase family protein [Brachymonas sp.]